jgi:4-alpha-glucanotransferase
MRTAPRRAGILLPAFSPRREGDLGIGDTRALREWIDWAARHRVGFLQLLPINETGPDNSPYNAISSVALEPLYLALEPGLIPGLEAAEVAAARALLGRAADARRIDYPVVRRVKGGLLRSAWERVAGQAAADREFSAFRQAEAAWLDQYTTFRWLMGQAGGHAAWDQWPPAFATPAAAGTFLAAARRHDPAGVERELLFFAWVQWLCFRQWREVRAHADARGVQLMGDLPIGVAGDSHDVFFDGEVFDPQWCGGAPPESMFTHDRFLQQWGQNWGIPLYRWEAMEQHGYPWWRRRVARLTEIFHLFRIDHVLGFYRIYGFPWRPRRNHEFVDLGPAEAAAKTGGLLPRWVPRPDDTAENKAANRADGDRRLRMVLDAAGPAEVVAEDLGWVPDYVRPHLDSLGIAGFRIPHWDVGDGGHPVPGAGFPECSFATYATHDHDSLPAMWELCRANATGEVPGLDHWAVEGARRNLRLLAEFAGIPAPADPADWPLFSDAVKWPLIDALLASRSRHAAVMVTDLFGLTDRINTPGTAGGGNWSLRLPWTVAGLKKSKVLGADCKRLRESIRNAGRG